MKKVEYMDEESFNKLGELVEKITEAGELFIKHSKDANLAMQDLAANLEEAGRMFYKQLKEEEEIPNETAS